MVAYPDDFPAEAVGTILQVISTGDWGPKKDEFAHAVWNLQGYLQKMILPLKDDDGNSLLSVNALALQSTLDDEEAVEALQHLQANPPTFSVASADASTVQAYALALPLPAIVLLKWLLGKLIEEVVK